MKSVRLFCVTAVTFLIYQSENVDANNNYFLPGDAFFHTILTQDEISKLEKNPKSAFYYHFVCEPAFCGYAGYSKLTLTEKNLKLAKNISKAYYQIRKSVPLELRAKNDSTNSESNNIEIKPTQFEEINGLSLFFYNEAYEWKKRKIAIKYNEDWLKDLQKFGFNSGRYCEFVKTSDAIVRSWASGSSIAPLSVELPEAPIKKYKTFDIAMRSEGPLKALILFDRDYKQYFNMKDGLQLLEVSNKEINHYIIRNGKWILLEE